MDIEYHGLIYGDAELREGIWYLRNGEGSTPFLEQQSVNPLTAPSPNRRHTHSFYRCPITVAPERTDCSD